MRKIVVVSLLIMSVLFVACSNGGNEAVPVFVDDGTGTGDNGADSSFEQESPRIESTPTPPLPPTFTPPAMAHQGHLYLLPVSGADGSIQYAYKVRLGDNLTSISEMYGVSVEEVLLVNNISDANHIEVGDLVIIPIEG